jgi:hypothetical protein
MQMVASSKWGRALMFLASAGICLPLAPATAEEIQSAKPPVIRDVELEYGGLLIGRLVDANGRPQCDTHVSVVTSGKTLATTRSDAEGVFAVSKLRGGVHEIRTAENVQVCRLWAHDTAPPRVPKSIDVVSNGDVVRGQYGPPPGNRFIKKAKVWATNPFIVGGVVAAAVAIPVALSDNDGPHS